MLMMTKRNLNLSYSVDYQNAGPTMTFLSVYTHARDQSLFMAVAMKAMHTASTNTVLPESMHSDV